MQFSGITYLGINGQIWETARRGSLLEKRVEHAGRSCKRSQYDLKERLRKICFSLTMPQASNSLNS